MLTRWFGELAVIVLGVLIALGADAAWSERVERVQERAVLEDLLDELEQNVDRMEADAAANDAAIAGTDSLIALLTSDTPASREELDRLIAVSYQWARFDPITGATTSLVDGGELGLIENVQLRHRVAGWLGRARENTQTAIDNNTVVSDALQLVMPALDVGEPLPSSVAAARLMSSAVRSQTLQLRELNRYTRDLIREIEIELNR